MNIFLAGKIARKCWRHMLVTGLDEVLEHQNFDDGWPVMEKAIFGKYGYTGPYFRKIEKMLPGQKVHRLCMEAIDRSDLVFSWFDDPEAYASMFEFGYAKAKGIPIVIVYPDGFDTSEFWFQSCCSTVFLHGPGPVTAFKTGMMKYALLQSVRSSTVFGQQSIPPKTGPDEGSTGASAGDSQGGDAGSSTSGEHSPRG